MPYAVEAQHGEMDGLVYTAPDASEEVRSDHLLVTDAAGASRSVVVTLVRPIDTLALSARPGETLLLDQLINGAGVGLSPFAFRWDPQGNSSGGTLRDATYTAGENADTIDTVIVSDAAGQTGTLTISVLSPEWPLADRKIIAGDFDGNGWPDFVGLARGFEPRLAFVSSSLRSAPRLVYDEPISDRFAVVERPVAMDIDGDGADELIGIIGSRPDARLAAFGGAVGGPRSTVQSIRLPGIEPTDPVVLDTDRDHRPDTLAIYNHVERPSAGELCPPAHIIIFRTDGDGLKHQACVPTRLPTTSTMTLFAGRFDDSGRMSIGYFDAPLVGPAWLGYLDYDPGTRTFSFPSEASRPSQTTLLPPGTRLVGVGDFDGNGYDEVLLQTHENVALLIQPWCLDPEHCELRADQPPIPLDLSALGTRPLAFTGELTDRHELFVGVPGGTELHVWGFVDGAWGEPRTLPLRTRLPPVFEVLTLDMDTDERNDLVIAGNSLLIQLGDGLGGLDPGDRWRVPDALVMAPFPGKERALAAGHHLRVLGVGRDQLFFGDQTELGARLVFNAQPINASAEGDLLVLTEDGLLRTNLAVEGGVERLAFRPGTAPPLTGLELVRRGMGRFPLLLTEPVFSADDQGSFPAKVLQLEEEGLVPHLDFVDKPGTERHIPVMLGDFGARDGVPDLLVSPYASPNEPLLYYPGSLTGSRLSFDEPPVLLEPAHGTDSLRYTDARWIRLTRDPQAEERLVLFGIARAPGSLADIFVHVQGSPGVTTRTGALAEYPTVFEANLDGDDFTDLVIVSDTTSIVLLYGDGEGGFTVGCRPLGFAPRDGWLLDADGDGLDDVAVFDPALESVFLLRHRERILGKCR